MLREGGGRVHVRCIALIGQHHAALHFVQCCMRQLNEPMTVFHQQQNGHFRALQAHTSFQTYILNHMIRK